MIINMEEKHLKWCERDYLIGLNMITGLGPQRIRTLLSHFSDIAQIWECSMEELASVPGIGRKIAQAILQERKEMDPITEQAWAAQHDARIVTWFDLDYPHWLRDMPGAPPVLYCRGNLPSCLGVGIVGSRKATTCGKKQAYHFAYTLASYGIPIISGLARGIDSQAHLGALAAGGCTVAVLATPIHLVYPPENRNLAMQISRSGCLLTEFPSRSQVRPGNFPQRNRLIAAFSHGVLVVEAGIKSGTLSTVDAALEFGREVWAIPGDIAEPLRKGTHMLIKQGAGLVDSPDDILAHFPTFCQEHENQLDHYTRIVFKYYLQGYTPEEIVTKTGLSVQQVQNSLTILELEGLLRTAP